MTDWNSHAMRMGRKYSQGLPQKPRSRDDIIDRRTQVDVLLACTAIVGSGKSFVIDNGDQKDNSLDVFWDRSLERERNNFKLWKAAINMHNYTVGVLQGILNALSPGSSKVIYQDQNTVAEFYEVVCGLVTSDTLEAVGGLRDPAIFSRGLPEDYESLASVFKSRNENRNLTEEQAIQNWVAFKLPYPNAFKKDIDEAFVKYLQEQIHVAIAGRHADVEWAQHMLNLKDEQLVTMTNQAVRLERENEHLEQQNAALLGQGQQLAASATATVNALVEQGQQLAAAATAAVDQKAREAAYHAQQAEMASQQAERLRQVAEAEAAQRLQAEQLAVSQGQAAAAAAAAAQQAQANEAAERENARREADLRAQSEAEAQRLANIAQEQATIAEQKRREAEEANEKARQATEAAQKAKAEREIADGNTAVVAAKATEALAREANDKAKLQQQLRAAEAALAAAKGDVDRIAAALAAEQNKPVQFSSPLPPVQISTPVVAPSLATGPIQVSTPVVASSAGPIQVSTPMPPIQVSTPVPTVVTSAGPAPAQAPAQAPAPAPAKKYHWTMTKHNKEKLLAQAKADKWWASHPRAEKQDKAIKAKTIVKTAAAYIPGKNDFRGVDTAPSSGKRRVKF